MTLAGPLRDALERTPTYDPDWRTETAGVLDRLRADPKTVKALAEALDKHQKYVEEGVTGRAWIACDCGWNLGGKTPGWFVDHQTEQVLNALLGEPPVAGRDGL